MKLYGDRLKCIDDFGCKWKCKHIDITKPTNNKKFATYVYWGCADNSTSLKVIVGGII